MKAVSEKIAALREEGRNALETGRIRFAVGMGTCGIAAGARQTKDSLAAACSETGLVADIVEVGCSGMCWAEPIVELQLPGAVRVVYGNVDEECARGIARATAAGKLHERCLLGVIGGIGLDETVRADVRQSPENACVSALLQAAGDAPRLGEIPFIALQKQRVMSRSGRIVPWSVEEYAACGGFGGLAKVLCGMTPAGVIEEIDMSGLRGRGGAGYPTGQKWRGVASQQADERFVIANADEGDPGAFMNRGLMESDPLSIVEGMIVSGYAVGAHRGYIFTRSEYPLALERLSRAIEESRVAGVLGSNVLGSGFSFDINLVKSAGAYLCGEGTAMVAAMEGKPGLPRLKRPPHLSERGLWDKPTCLNNVETFADVALIMAHGSSWFREVGTDASPGTKVFAIAGATERTGLVELALGTPIHELLRILQVASAREVHPTSEQARFAQSGRRVRACQIGGPSGALLPIDLDLSLDYESLNDVGASIGSGGLILIDERVCIVDTVRHLVAFSADESCKRCKLCREGLARCVRILDRLCAGTASDADFDELHDLAIEISAGKLCGLGRLAVRPVLTSLRYFEEEYRAHIDGRCPALTCKELIDFYVVGDLCPGCRCCKPTCPTNAMMGKFGKPYRIDPRLCIRCWMCTATCPYDAVRARSPRST